MHEQPETGREAADERRIAELVRAVEVPAPDALHAFTAQLIEGSRTPQRSTRLRRRVILVDSAALIAAAAAVIVALILAGGSSPPTALRAARLALASATGPAPHALVASGTSIAFPDWSRRGWPSSGARSDRLDGRTVTTEYYRAYRASAAIGYSIVSGAPVRWGESGRTVVRAHGDYLLLSGGGAHIVAWVQQGHTCILASRTASDATLLTLAAAQEGGPATVSSSWWSGPAAAPL
ncbi:MAG TPA: hypothetical protein VID68_12950 [Solirubrobacteraceae bacterium]|jgi:hypothetical protein